MSVSANRMLSEYENPTKVCIRRLGLIAGEGFLPVHAAQNARNQGLEVVTLALGSRNVGALKNSSHGLHRISPGVLGRTLALLKQEKVSHVVFAGKVNKWILLRNPQLDELGWQVLRKIRQTQQGRTSDDGLMGMLVNTLEAEGIVVLRQTDFLQDLFLDAGLLTQRAPTEQEALDIRYGFETAKEMGRLDIGQTVVVKDGMMLAIEAIEGTDECLKRGGSLAHGKGGVVVKVAKPAQDHRFDVPTVGLDTLKTMKKAGLHILATEAGATLFIDPAEMTAFANRHGMTVISVEGQELGR